MIRESRSCFIYEIFYKIQIYFIYSNQGEVVQKIVIVKFLYDDFKNEYVVAPRFNEHN